MKKFGNKQHTGSLAHNVVDPVRLPGMDLLHVLYNLVSCHDLRGKARLQASWHHRHGQNTLCQESTLCGDTQQAWTALGLTRHLALFVFPVIPDGSEGVS